MAPEFPIRTKSIIMDKQLIKKFGQDILSYRIRTERQKKRARYEDFDKYLIQLDLEEKELYRKKRNLGWMLLDPPVQRGWIRFFALREDLARSRDAGFFDNILKKINTLDWSSRKDFKVKRHRYARKTLVVKTQKLLEHDEKQFERLGFSERERRFFHIEYRLEKGRFYVCYVFSEPWRFVLRIRPNIIDKVRIRDEALEARMQQIRYYMERNDYRKRQMKILYGGSKWRHYGENYEYYNGKSIKNRPVRDIVEEGKEEVL